MCVASLVSWTVRLVLVESSCNLFWWVLSWICVICSRRSCSYVRSAVGMVALFILVRIVVGVMLFLIVWFVF